MGIEFDSQKRIISFRFTSFSVCIFFERTSKLVSLAFKLKCRFFFQIIQWILVFSFALNANQLCYFKAFDSHVPRINRLETMILFFVFKANIKYSWKWNGSERKKKSDVGNNIQLTTFHIPPAWTLIPSIISTCWIDTTHAIYVGQLFENACNFSFIHAVFFCFNQVVLSTRHFRVNNFYKKSDDDKERKRIEKDKEKLKERNGKAKAKTAEAKQKREQKEKQQELKPKINVKEWETDHELIWKPCKEKTYFNFKVAQFYTFFAIPHRINILANFLFPNSMVNRLKIPSFTSLERLFLDVWKLFIGWNERKKLVFCLTFKIIFRRNLLFWLIS